MKSYTITVNGVAYDVTVEEGAGNAAAPAAAPNLQHLQQAQWQLPHLFRVKYSKWKQVWDRQ